MTNPSNISSLLAFIVADDLTGACDAAAAFANAGYKTEVLLNGSGKPNPSSEVIAISTESRDVTPQEAAFRIQEIVSRFAVNRPVHLFKKIDSVFRGNTFYEIAESIRHLPHDIAILAPAFPAVGRSIVDGVLETTDLGGSTKLDLISPLQAVGLKPRCVAMSDLKALDLKDRLVVCDARSDEDLRAVVAMALAIQHRKTVLWIGSGGLAHALAGNRASYSEAEGRSWPKGRVIFVIGSDHPVTQAQWEQLNHCLAASKRDCVIVPAPRNLELTELRQRLITANSGQVRCIFVTGGYTAMKLCAALAIERLQVQCELTTGIPMTIAQGGPMHGTLVILKSGGFGGATLLIDIAERFATNFQEEFGMAEVRLPHIVISLGDPAGVGGEVTLKALAHPEIATLAHWTVLGDRPVLEAAERTTGIAFASLGATFQDCEVLDSDESVEYGTLRAEYGKAAARYVHDATLMCLSGEADAIVTAPLNKEAVTMSGMTFSGHTEYIAELCGSSESRMLLAGVKLSVIHVSTHTSLRNACNLNTERIVRTIELGNDAMRLRGIAHPRIAVCGLNPHAGEHGLFGTEDAEFILPAVEACRAQGIDCEGPVAPDTIFVKASKGSHDLIVAMYHDQGHIPMKLLDFEATVNMSLGIPIIRTSVDHGTAFDIAGKNIASEANMIAALKMAATMAAHRIHQPTGANPEPSQCAH
ncbi:hypothetical protein BH10ACI4_BH10ACI4_18640 [soil metagenome]